MKAQEVRFGNFVYDTEGKVNIVDINAIKYLLKYGDRSLCQVKPIPLTEEWLVKFGFEYSNDNLQPRYQNGLVWIWPTNGKLLDDNDKEIKYVHQLQNLYFALTGEELTI